MWLQLEEKTRHFNKIKCTKGEINVSLKSMFCLFLKVAVALMKRTINSFKNQTIVKDLPQFKEGSLKKADILNIYVTFDVTAGY